MTLSRRFTTGALALSLAVASVVAVPTAASAASTRLHHSVDGMQSKAVCQQVERLNLAHIVRKGGELVSGSSCAWLGAKKKWGYDVYYIQR